MSFDWIERWMMRPVGVLAWSGAILLAGIWATFQVPLEWVPQVELPIVRVSAGWPGASPRAVERYVTAPIERAIQRVPGTESVESLSEEGMASLTLHVSKDVDVGLYVAQLNEQLTVLRGTLPDRVWPRLTKQIPESLRDEQGFMTVQLIAPLSLDEVRTLADRRIRPRLQSIPGMSDIEIIGGTQRELRITLNPDRLTATGIGAGEVSGRIRELLGDDAYGRLRDGSRSALLMRTSEDRIPAFRDLVLRETGGAQVTLKDVAAVDMEPAPVRSISRIDGQPVVTLRIDRAKGSHLIDVARDVYTALEELEADLPEGARLIVADDRSEEVRDQMNDLRWRGGAGLLLVVIVLLTMLRSVRATVVVVFSVGVSLAVAMLVMQPLGLTLNLLTIAGLVLVFGLLVDNSVVVVEQLLIRRGPRATSDALRAVWLPLVGGTLSTMSVMVPLVYLSGDLRTLFLPFGILVAVTLGASLGAAALVVPVTTRFLPVHPPPGRAGRRIRRILAWPYRQADRFPRTTVLVLLLVLGLPVWLVPERITVDVPDTAPSARLASVYNAAFDHRAVRTTREWLDPVLGGAIRKFRNGVSFGRGWSWSPRPEVYVNMGFPPGHPIARADSLMSQFERTALASPSVERVILNVREESANMRLQFHEASLLTAEPYVLREQLIGQAVNIGGLRISVGGLVQDGYFSGVGGGISGVRLELRGPNYEDLDLLARQFARHLEGRSRRVAGVDVNADQFGRFQAARQVLRFDWSPESEERSGHSAQAVAAALAPVFRTRFPMAYADLEEDVQIPVRVLVSGADDADIADVMERPLAMGNGRELFMGEVAEYTIETRPSGVRRADQQYQRFMAVDFRGPGQMANDFVEAELAAFAVPVGYSIDMASFSFFTDEVKESFAWMILATLLLVFIVTAAVFESWRLPLVVIVSVPLSAVGVSWGFAWTGANFAEGAFIGSILMVGIAVNDSILLVDRYRQHRERRPWGNAGQLMRLAVRERLRPMVTTTLTSIVSMAPMLIYADNADFWTGLAVTVIGGLTASTLLAPVMAVALVSYIGRITHRKQAS
ncbi:MAG: efflux RND transporter permease subunit [Rhodothermales bacterium]